MFEPTKILITGASGFIGSFLCEEALRQQMSVWAGVRSTSSRKWLQNEWLQFQTLDMTNRDVLHSQLAHFKENHGKWDIIIHAAGATKCLNPEDFDTANVADDKLLMNFEPDDETVLDQVIPKYMSNIIFGALLEAVASENGARMQAMDSATNNAEDMIASLELSYNRARQGAITQELTEIIAGADAVQ